MDYCIYLNIDKLSDTTIDVVITKYPIDTELGISRFNPFNAG